MRIPSEISFLLKLLSDPWYSMNIEDLNHAIELANTELPIAAYNAADSYYRGRHGSVSGGGAEQFAKGVKSLATIRHREGEKAFQEVVRRIAR